MNLSHNAIQFIQAKTFSKLVSLITLDLSYNRLSLDIDLHPNLLQQNHNLVELLLNGNKFIRKPLSSKLYLNSGFEWLRSGSLRRLHLKDTQLSTLHLDLLRNLPNLSEIDLSHNLLITFERNLFKWNINLNLLNLKQNPLICDDSLQQEINYLMEIKDIQIEHEKCVKKETRKTVPRKNEKLQMIMANSIENYSFSSKENDYPTIEGNLLGEESSLANPCLQEQIISKKSNSTILRSQISDIHLAFCLGVAVGVFIIIIIISTALCIKICCFSSKNAICKLKADAMCNNN